MSELSEQLGPYQLGRRIGSGGMADVWRGVHREHGVEVAVKILRDVTSDQTELRLRREIQAVARLDHPAIVRILDYGNIPDTVDVDGVHPGAPYFVMEYTDGGSLAEALTNGIGWLTIRRALNATLDALAHAHARGVIHRDLKPDNILRFGDGRWKLADFGIASLRENSSGRVEANPSGTPGYMSPEQFRGMFRDMGPWTDLYSLGCMAWQLTTGAVPFDGKSTIDVARKHFVQVPPEFEPQVPVPDGFEAWVRRLLSKVPHDRYLWAADASWALNALVDPAPTDATSQASAAELETVLTPGLGVTLQMGELGDETLAYVSASTGTERVDDRAPVRSDWRMHLAYERTPLDGASPRLVGLRWPRLVGRIEERDRLWRALTEMATAEGRTVVIRGPAGCGKSRLVQWLSMRGHELGVADTVRAQASREPTPAQSPPGAITEYLGFDGLEEHLREPRLERLADRYGWPRRSGDVLLDALHRMSAGETPPSDWAAACDDILTSNAATRPLIIWIDDLQWAPHWITYMGRDPQLEGVMFVATVRSEEASGPVEKLLQRWTGRSDVVDLDLEELPVQDCVKLVTELLRVERPLAERIARRADGNPMFATQLVTDWMGRGLLVARAHGWELREGVEPSIPEDVTRVWSARVDHLLDGRPPTLQRGLELAAVLGKDVRHPEYDASRTATMPAWETLGDVLGADALIVRVDDEHWEFVHEMLREAIVRRASVRGTLADTHRQAAEGLLRLQDEQRVNLAPRIGRHLYEAGRYADALEHLRLGAEATLATTDIATAERLLEKHRRALERLGRGDGLERWEGELVDVRRLHQSERKSASVEKARLVVETARQRGWKDLEARALERMARTWNSLGNEQESGRAARKALRLFDELGDVAGAAKALLRLGDHYAYLTAFDESCHAYRRAIELAAQVDEPTVEAWAHYGLGFVELQRGRLDIAREHLTRSIEQFAKSRSRYYEIVVGVTLGDVERMAGNFDRAHELYLASRELSGGTLRPVVRMNLCLLELGRAQLETARDHIARILEALDAPTETSMALGIGVDALRAFFAANDGDFDEWADHFQRFTDEMNSAGVLEFDTVYAGDLAVREAVGQFSDRRDELREAIESTVQWWVRLGRVGEAEALRRIA